MLKQLGHSTCHDRESFSTKDETWAGPPICPRSTRTILTLSSCTLTSQDPRGFEQPILIHDGEHALQFFGGCLCAIDAIIACEFDKPKTMQA
jgi:hypothetical protein